MLAMQICWSVVGKSVQEMYLRKAMRKGEKEWNVIDFSTRIHEFLTYLHSLYSEILFHEDMCYYETFI